MGSRLFNLLIAIDQLVYVLVTLGGGLPGETMSAAAWRTEQEGKILGRFFRPKIDWLMLKLCGQVDHCHAAFDSIKAQNYIPPEEKVGSTMS